LSPPLRANIHDGFHSIGIDQVVILKQFPHLLALILHLNLKNYIRISDKRDSFIPQKPGMIQGPNELYGPMLKTLLLAQKIATLTTISGRTCHNHK